MDKATRELVHAAIGLCWAAEAIGDGGEQGDVRRVMRAVEAVSGRSFNEMAEDWHQAEVDESMSRHDEQLESLGHEPSYTSQGHSADEMPF